MPHICVTLYVIIFLPASFFKPCYACETTLQPLPRQLIHLLMQNIYTHLEFQSCGVLPVETTSVQANATATPSAGYTTDPNVGAYPGGGGMPRLLTFSPDGSDPTIGAYPGGGGMPRILSTAITKP